MLASRRRFLLGAATTLVAAPAIVRVAAHLMPLSAPRRIASLPLYEGPTDWRFDVLYGTLRLEEFSERYLKPQMIVLAGQIDESIASELWRTYPRVAHG